MGNEAKAQADFDNAKKFEYDNGRFVFNKKSSFRFGSGKIFFWKIFTLFARILSCDWNDKRSRPPI